MTRRFGTYLLLALLQLLLTAVNAFLPSRGGQLANGNQYGPNASKRKSKGPSDDDAPSKQQVQALKSTTRSWDPLEIMKGHSSEARAVSEPRGATFYMADNSLQKRSSAKAQAPSQEQSSQENAPAASFDPMSSTSTDQFVETVAATKASEPKKSGAKPTIASVGPNFDPKVHSSYAETASSLRSRVVNSGVASWQPDLKERVLKEASGSFVRSVAVDSSEVRAAPSGGRSESSSASPASSGGRTTVASWDPLRQSDAVSQFVVEPAAVRRKSEQKAPDTMETKKTSRAGSSVSAWDPLTMMKGHSSEARAVSAPQGSSSYLDGYFVKGSRTGSTENSKKVKATSLPKTSGAGSSKSESMVASSWEPPFRVHSSSGADQSAPRGSSYYVDPNIN